MPAMTSTPRRVSRSKISVPDYPYCRRRAHRQRGAPATARARAVSKDPPAPQVWHFVQEPGDVPAKGKGRNLTAEETQQWRAWATAKLAAFERGFTKTKDPAVRAFFVHSALSLCGDRPPYFVLKWAADQAKAQLPHDKNAAFLLNYNGLMKSLRAEYEEAKAEAKKQEKGRLSHRNRKCGPPSVLA